MDFRAMMPDIVPATYLRNATYPRSSPRIQTVDETQPNDTA